MDIESALEPLRTLEAALDNPSLKALVFAHRLLPLRPGGPMEAWSNLPPPPTSAPQEDEASDLRAKFQGALVDLHRRRDRVILSLLTSDPPSSQEPVKVPGLDDLRWRHTFTAPGYALLRERWSRDADWILRREPYRRPPALARDVAHLVVVGRNPDGHELGTRGNDEGYFQHFQGAAAVDLRRLEEDIGIAPLVALLARFDTPTVILTHARGGAFERLKSGITAVLRIDAEAAMTDGDPRAEAIVDQAVTTLTGGDVDGIEILVLGRPWVSPALREVTARIHGRLDARCTKVTVVSPDEVSIPHEWTRWRPEPVVHRCFDLVDALHDMLLARDLPVGGLNEGQSPPGERPSEGS